MTKKYSKGEQEFIDAVNQREREATEKESVFMCSIFQDMAVGLTAIQNVLEFVDHLKHSKLYKQQVKKKLNEVEVEANKYLLLMQDSFGKDGSVYDQEAMVKISDMCDNIDLTVTPLIKSATSHYKSSFDAAGVSESQIYAEMMIARDMADISVTVHDKLTRKLKFMYDGIIMRLWKIRMTKVLNAMNVLKTYMGDIYKKTTVPITDEVYHGVESIASALTDGDLMVKSLEVGGFIRKRVVETK